MRSGLSLDGKKNNDFFRAAVTQEAGSVSLTNTHLRLDTSIKSPFFTDVIDEMGSLLRGLEKINH